MTVQKSLIVYLAGGTRSNWAAEVKKAVPGPIYLDPKEHGLESELDYTDWDLTAVAMADVVFCNLEADNPSGIGMALEVGAAAALGKTIIYRQDVDVGERAKYFGMVRRCATVTVDSLKEGCEHLSMYLEDSRKKRLFA